MKAGSITASNCDAQTNETEPGNGSIEPKKRRDMPQATDNKRLAEQIRKILGKHYASKYRGR